MEQNPIIAENKAVSKQKIRIDILRLLTYFLVCAFVGWVAETTAVAFGTGKFTYRGYFFVMKPLAEYIPALSVIPFFGAVPFVWGLPIIEIYGFGGVIIVFAFQRFRKKPIRLFLISTVSMTVFELIASYFCTIVLKRSYWDYSNDFLNFQGRICLRSALSWGALSLGFIILFAPLVDKLYEKVKNKKGFRITVYVLIAYAAVCAVVKYIIYPDIIPN